MDLPLSDLYNEDGSKSLLRIDTKSLERLVVMANLRQFRKVLFTDIQGERAQTCNSKERIKFQDMIETTYQDRMLVRMHND